jgi:hypothetical protein
MRFGVLEEVSTARVGREIDVRTGPEVAGLTVKPLRHFFAVPVKKEGQEKISQPSTCN